MPRSAAPARSFGRGKARTDSFEIITAPPQHPLVRVLGLLIRLRAEITVLAVCLTVWFTLRAHTSLVVTITVCVVLLGLLAGLPPARRYLVRRSAAVMTRHRLRQTLVECRVLNFSRACPLLLWSRPTPVGEVVWLLLRAGISADDVADQAAEIAAGCFAREARATARTQMTTLVRVEIIRRDPLAAESIDSDLGPWANGWDSPVIPFGAAPAPKSTEPTGQSDPAPRVPVPELVPAVRDSDDDTSASGRGGDWSDYV